MQQKNRLLGDSVEKPSYFYAKLYKIFLRNSYRIIFFLHVNSIFKDFFYDFP